PGQANWGAWVRESSSRRFAAARLSVAFAQLLEAAGSKIRSTQRPCLLPHDRRESSTRSQMASSRGAKRMQSNLNSIAFLALIALLPSYALGQGREVERGEASLTVSYSTCL